MELVREIYILTAHYTREEMFGLTSQTKRAAISIPSNIAEGIGRNYKKDTIQFLHIARGSCYELETQIHIALMVKIINEEQFNSIITLIERVMQLVNGLINSYEKRQDLK